MLNHERAVGLESAKSFEAKKKKQKRKLTLIDYAQRMEEAHQNINVKSLIDFDRGHSTSIRAVMVHL